MQLQLTAAQRSFRDEVREFLAANLPPAEERGPGFILEWWKMVREKRWIGFSWPTEVTGGGASVMQQFILKEELLAAEAPMLLGSDYTGLHWVGPAIIQFGSEEQKAEYIPEILDSRSVWCTGYSEPDVGSERLSPAFRCFATPLLGPNGGGSGSGNSFRHPMRLTMRRLLWTSARLPSSLSQWARSLPQAMQSRCWRIPPCYREER